MLVISYAYYMMMILIWWINQADDYWFTTDDDVMMMIESWYDDIDKLMIVTIFVVTWILRLMYDFYILCYICDDGRSCFNC